MSTTRATSTADAPTMYRPGSSATGKPEGATMARTAAAYSAADGTREPS